jgi:hypothetical protein
MSQHNPTPGDVPKDPVEGQCPETTTDLGNPTRCSLPLGHAGMCDDGCIGWTPRRPEARPDPVEEARALLDGSWEPENWKAVWDANLATWTIVDPATGCMLALYVKAPQMLAAAPRLLGALADAVDARDAEIAALRVQVEALVAQGVSIHKRAAEAADWERRIIVDWLREEAHEFEDGGDETAADHLIDIADRIADGEHEEGR